MGMLAEEYLGVPTDSWSMTFRETRNAEHIFSNGDAGIEYFARETVPTELFVTPEDRAFLRDAKRSGNPCQAYLEKSIAEYGPLDED